MQKWKQKKKRATPSQESKEKESEHDKEVVYRESRQNIKSTKDALLDVPTTIFVDLPSDCCAIFMSNLSMQVN